MTIKITYPSNVELRTPMQREVDKLLISLGDKATFNTSEEKQPPGTLGPSPDIISTAIECASNAAQFLAAIVPLLIQIYVWKKKDRDKTPENRATIEIDGKKLSLPATRDTIKTFMGTLAKTQPKVGARVKDRKAHKKTRK